MSQADKARQFADLHVPGSPVVLYNIWDAGSAKAIADAGAKAVATGSWSVAAAHGYSDGQAIPIDLALQVISRIVETVDLPVSLDFEGGYAESPEGIEANIARVLETGAIGINFEDQVVGGSGLHPVEAQSANITAARRAADSAGIPFFINARTDLFLKQKDRAKHGELIAEAKDRAAAYAEAGASGFFAPGLADPDLIGGLCETSSLPVNIIMFDGVPAVDMLASLGVARVSYGPRPYVWAMADVAERFRGISTGS